MSRSARKRSSSSTQNGSARIAGSWPWSRRRESGARVAAAGRCGEAPLSRPNASSCEESWPGASTNVGSSWTEDSSSTAGGAGRPSLSAATQRRAAALVKPRMFCSMACQDSSVRGTVTPPGALTRTFAQLGWQPDWDRQAKGTPAHRARRRRRSFRARWSRESATLARGDRCRPARAARAAPRSGARHARRRQARKSPRAPRVSAGRCERQARGQAERDRPRSDTQCCLRRSRLSSTS